MNLVGLLLIVVYGAGAWKFWTGFPRTFLVQNLPNRLSFALLWPAWLINASGRRNLNKALKG